MSYHVIWSKRATKELLAIPKKQRLMVAEWIQKNLDGVENPKGIPGAKPLQGTAAGWRYRVGSYRVLVSIRDDELVIEVVRVGHRQGVYSKLPKI